jgi:hypothetical protein
MAIAPTIGTTIIEKTASKDFGYFWASFFWMITCAFGLILNVWLYFEDIRNNKGVLNKVHVGATVQDLMTSPTQE